MNIQRVAAGSLARDGGRVLGNECVSCSKTSYIHTYTTLKSPDYNVVMTFTFNNNNNNK